MTPRELQALALLAEGHSYGQIADDLGVSYKTVANICAQLKVKLGARSFPDLIARPSNISPLLLASRDRAAPVDGVTFARCQSETVIKPQPSLQALEVAQIERSRHIACAARDLEAHSR